MVAGAGGTKLLFTKDGRGTYHIDNELVIADKAGMKLLTN
jgi:hypothetical protein